MVVEIRRVKITQETPAEDGKADEWTKGYSTYFWHSGPPYDVKFEMENTMRLLLERDQLETAKLTYSGSSLPPTIGYRLQLRFEEALPDGNWYWLHVEAWVPRSWYTEPQFLEYADRAFGYLGGKLQVADEPTRLESASKELYEQRLREALERERQAKLPEDRAPILLLQQEILKGLREGQSFRTSHHEGGTSIHFDGKKFVRSTYGEEESLEVFKTEEEALGSIRQFYDWESRRDTFPHRPPELEVWRFIQRQMT